MKTLVTGASGLVGSALTRALTSDGHEVVRAVRDGNSSGPDAIAWDPAAGTIDTAGLEGLDSVVHLAGESITGRWNAAKKKRIRDSRLKGTALLAGALAKLERKPRELICASAIGYYGDRGVEKLNEESPPGSGFLADVCRDWEEAAKPAAAAGIRLVHVRIGVVLSPEGGALAQMLPPFRLGAGGKLGRGDQFMSWISLDDLVDVIRFALRDKSVSGAVNGVAPNPLTNLEFTKTLGRVLSRPTFFPMPAFAARLLFGEMADALLLASTRVLPSRLEERGFSFRHPDMETALRSVLGKA